MAMIKSPALRGGNTVPLDTRSFTIGQLMNMSIEQSEAFVYPRMYALHNLATLPDAGTLLDTSTSSKMAPQGAKCVAVSHAIAHPAVAAREQGSSLLACSCRGESGDGCGDGDGEGGGGEGGGDCGGGDSGGGNDDGER